jgi:hypothetical protein
MGGLDLQELKITKIKGTSVLKQLDKFEWMRQEQAMPRQPDWMLQGPSIM